ncbi:hypothetical protein [Noviherbaspirillum massiliense]|uniref:hypothetical protein n=1 Tax=Noviherbaspirillum massiliense TaxID=1465823 RepID=UPI0002E59BAE|nr:hypothetical protein [Noviherbaspirillum massiliense]
MKSLIVPLAAACSFLTGCVAVPVADPGVSVSATVHASDGPRYRAMRDSDGDGVPNRYDRRPRNPYRY